MSFLYHLGCTCQLCLNILKNLGSKEAGYIIDSEAYIVVSSSMLISLTQLLWTARQWRSATWDAIISLLHKLESGSSRDFETIQWCPLYVKSFTSLVVESQVHVVNCEAFTAILGIPIFMDRSPRLRVPEDFKYFMTPLSLIHNYGITFGGLKACMLPQEEFPSTASGGFLDLDIIIYIDNCMHYGICFSL